jgi:hypothetical protein
MNIDRKVAAVTSLLEEFGYKELARETATEQERKELEKEMDRFVKHVEDLANGKVQAFEVDPVNLPKLYALNVKKLSQGVIKPGEIYKVK